MKAIYILLVTNLLNTFILHYNNKFIIAKLFMALNNKKSFYNILGVSNNARIEDIIKAYKKLALKHHPDKPGGNNNTFKKLSEAYTALKNTETRKKYNNRRQHSYKSTHNKKSTHKKSNRDSTRRNSTSRKHNAPRIHHVHDDKNYDKQGIKINKVGRWIDANDIQADAFRRFEDINNLNKAIKAINIDGSEFNICRLGLKQGIYISINGEYYPIINFDNIKIYNNICEWVSDKDYETALGFNRITSLYLDFIYNNHDKSINIRPQTNYMGKQLDYSIQISLELIIDVKDPLYYQVLGYIQKAGQDESEIIVISNNNNFISTYKYISSNCTRLLAKT